MGILGAAGAADQWREIEAEALRQALLKRESARQDEELKLRQTELAENRAWRQDERNYRRQQELDAQMRDAVANAPLNGADRLELTPEMQAWVTADPSRVIQYQPKADMTLGSRQFGSAAEATPRAQGGLAAPAAALGTAQYSAPQATGTMSINPMSRAEQAQRAAVAEATRRYEEGLKRTDRDFSADEAYRNRQLGLSERQLQNQALGISLQADSHRLQREQHQQALKALAQRVAPGNTIAMKGLEDEINGLEQQLLTDARTQGQFGERFREADPRQVRINQLRQVQNQWIADNRAAGRDPWDWSDLSALLLQVQAPKRETLLDRIAKMRSDIAKPAAPLPAGASIPIPGRQ